MKLFKLSLTFAVLLFLVSFQNCSIVATPTIEESKVSSSTASSPLEAKAMRVINSKCTGCHNAQSPGGGIDSINNVNYLLYNQLIVPNEPDLSYLYEVVKTGDMPPAGALPLSTSEIQDIYNWIQDGFKAGTGGVAPPPVVTTLTPTYRSIYALILTPKCLGCHNSNNPRGGVSYSNYNSALNTVQPGNPNASTLYTEVLSGAMPQGGARLTNNELNVIQTWITNGALNN